MAANEIHRTLAKASARWRGTARPPLGTRRARHRATPPLAPQGRKRASDQISADAPHAAPHQTWRREPGESWRQNLSEVRLALPDPAPRWLSPQRFSRPPLGLASTPSLVISVPGQWLFVPHQMASDLTLRVLTVPPVPQMIGADPLPVM